ncbi:MAG: excinuclease ABC subunit UvrC [Gammaproteobacteria bacterium]
MNTSFDAKAYLKTVSRQPGVYRMFDAEGTIIYVGKARNLKQRLSSYFQNRPHDAKTRALVERIHHIETTVTHTETEALLLENNLIKALKPRYNIVFRDDKSYPYIYLSTQQTFPRLSFHRGARRKEGRYFGPYPSSHAVRDTLQLLQKLFPVRQCKDSFYNNRSRPCLQYQIKRCTAPCVGFITPEQYAADVRHVELFLAGKSQQVIDELVKKMESAAQEQHYEEAAAYRDQIINLRRMQETQHINSADEDVDVIAVSSRQQQACLQLFTIRQGRNLGNQSYFPKMHKGSDSAELLEAFLSQHYLQGDKVNAANLPREIVLSHDLAERDWFAQALSQLAGRTIKIKSRVRGDRARWLDMARHNAELALQNRLGSQATMGQRLAAIQSAFGLDTPPERMECFDISHSHGEATVASCVVFDRNGPLKSDYRRFNIEGITPGDDYAAMRQALMRRYRRLQAGEARLPDILFIDGGKGQLTQAREVLEALSVHGVLMVGIAKGEGRKPGLETLCLADGGDDIILPADSPALHLIQHIRDEAHRFAITGHRARRGKKRTRSALEDIPGLGPKRRQQLLKQFGGLQEVARAGVGDLAKVPGISKQLAQSVYDAFHHVDNG